MNDEQGAHTVPATIREVAHSVTTGVVTSLFVLGLVFASAGVVQHSAFLRYFGAGYGVVGAVFAVAYVTAVRRAVR